MVHQPESENVVTWLNDFRDFILWHEAHQTDECYIIVPGRIIHRSTCETWHKLLAIFAIELDRYFAQDRIVWEKELRGETIEIDEYPREGPSLVPFPLCGVIGKEHLPNEAIAGLVLCSRCNP